MDTAALLAFYRCYRERRLAEAVAAFSDDFLFKTHLPNDPVDPNRPRSRAEFTLLCHKFLEDYDIVVGYRSPRRDSLGRIALGWGWSRLVNALFDLDVRDVDCAFKVFDRAVIERIAIQSVGALVNTEILVRALGAGFRIHEVPVRHRPRHAGTATGATPRVM